MLMIKIRYVLQLSMLSKVFGTITKVSSMGYSRMFAPPNYWWNAGEAFGGLVDFTLTVNLTILHWKIDL